jgi:hypothetical protein
MTDVLRTIERHVRQLKWLCAVNLGLAVLVCVGVWWRL